MRDEKEREWESILGRRQCLQNPEELCATNLSFTGASRGALWRNRGALGLVGGVGGERVKGKMKENGSKWSWRAVEYCFLLFVVMNRPSEQTGEIGPQRAPGLFHLSGVFATHIHSFSLRHTHTCGHTFVKTICAYWQTPKHKQLRST